MPFINENHPPPPPPPTGIVARQRVMHKLFKETRQRRMASIGQIWRIDELGGGAAADRRNRGRKGKEARRRYCGKKTPPFSFFSVCGS
jgi:hypothetical protein